MAIRNNQFSRDKDGDRFERLQLILANIAAFAAELGIIGDRLAWALAAVTAWIAARAAAGVEEGEKNDAFEDLHNKVEETAEYYAIGREMLTTVIYDFGGKPDDFIERYGFKGATPRLYNLLYDRIEKWLLEDARLKALIPPDPRVVADAVTIKLAALRDEMYALYNAAYTEKSESDAAFNAKHTLFAVDSTQLTFLLLSAKMVWGDDDPKLRLIGLCPKSEIWTHNKPYSPKNLAFDDQTGTFSWDAVEDVDSYELSARIAGTTGDWTTFWTGTETSTTDKPAAPGIYDVRCRAIEGENLGNWSGAIEVDLSQ